MHTYIIKLVHLIFQLWSLTVSTRKDRYVGVKLAGIIELLIFINIENFKPVQYSSIVFMDVRVRI